MKDVCSAMEKFKFQGKEWTPKDLARACMKDYSYRMRRLRCMSGSNKFRANLFFDLSLLMHSKNEKYYDEFFQIYPKKYHTYALASALGLDAIRLAANDGMGIFF